MARNFISGTSTDGGGSANTNTTSVFALFKNAILANAAWSLVEEFTNGTWDHKAFKCSAASSGLPSDFYVTMSKSTNALYFCVGEQYNSTTHTLSDTTMGAAAGSRALTIATGLPTTAANVVLGNPLTSNNAPGGNQFYYSCLATHFYCMAVDSDHIVIGGNSSAAVYLGAFTSLASMSDPMPLAAVSLYGQGGGTSGPSGTARHVGMAASPIPNYGWSLAEALLSNIRLGLANPLVFTSTDLLQGGKAHVYEVAVAHYSGSSGTQGYLRGKFKLLGTISGLPSGMAVGDTSIINGHTWMVATINTNAGAAILMDTGA